MSCEPWETGRPPTGDTSDPERGPVLTLLNPVFLNT